MYSSYPFNQQYSNQQLLRVNGIEGAKAYPSYPGSTVALFDNNEDVMYIKSIDQCGFPTIRIFRFEEIKEEVPKGDYVKREELEDYVKHLIQQYTGSEKDTTD